MKFSEWLRDRGRGQEPRPGFSPPVDMVGRWCYVASHEWSSDTIEKAIDEWMDAQFEDAARFGEITRPKDQGEQ